MKRIHQIILIATASSLVTAMITARLVTKNHFASMAQVSNAMDSFNNVGRVEAFDFLEELIRKGCHQQALEFLDHQQHLLLTSLRNHMQENAALKTQVFERSAAIGDRAFTAPSRPSLYVYPGCP